MCRGRERLTCHRCWNVGWITLNIIIHLLFNYFDDTSYKSEQNFIQACFPSAFIKLKLLCKHCSIASVALSKSISVHVVKTSNGQSFNDFRYCKHVLMYEIVSRLGMPGLPYSCYIQGPVTNFPIMLSACNCSNDLSFLKSFCNADCKLVVLRHEVSKIKSFSLFIV